MRIPPSSSTALAALLFPLLASASGSINCEHIQLNKIAWDLSPLAGPKSALSSVDQGPTFKNTTYTIDICRPLRRAKGEKQCPNGTRVCGIERIISKDDTTQDMIDRIIPIAGSLRDQGGYDLDAKWTRLKGSASNTDSEKEGLILEVQGGFIEKDNGDGKTSKRKQKAVVEFLCDKERDGSENLWQGEDKYDEKEKREDGEKKVVEGPSLEFLKYEEGEGDFDILRLRWRTKHACEDAKRELDAERGNHWGIFTWFIIIAFLSTAAYLIFGSWLNYNRYGARGWDLLPHGDTIRDVPYLAKDWMRSIMNTLQGSGTRGGYAAV